MKIHPVKTELFHADGKTDKGTDMTNLKVAFLCFAKKKKSPTKRSPLPVSYSDLWTGAYK